MPMGRHAISASLLSAVLLLSGVPDSLFGGDMLSVPAAHAKKSKKSKKKTDTLAKDLEPIMATLTTLQEKAKARELYSAEDAAKLDELRIQLMDVMVAHTGKPELAKVVYQAALLFERRDLTLDANEAYHYLAEHYGHTLYGRRGQLALEAKK